MAAYSACIPIKAVLWNIKKYVNVFFPAPLREIIDVAYNELKSFQEFAERLDSRSRKRMSASLQKRSTAIHGFHDAFESHLDKLWDDKLHEVNVGEDFSTVLSDLKRDTESLVETLKKTKEEEYSYSYPGDYEEVDSSSPGNYKMVGLRDVYTVLKERVLNGDHPIISLVGMAGIGKTTLAQKFFHDLDIIEVWPFHRAWVTVGKEFKLEEVKASILAQVDPRMYEMAMGGDKETVGEHLDFFLNYNPILIVLDDIWKEDDLHFLKNSFSYGRLVTVLLTTRFHYIAEAHKKFQFPILVRLLSKKESWDLLRVKVFGKDSCPPQLEDAGEKIAEKCDGLPLTIVTVAKLLSEAGKTQESLWIEVATRKKHQIFTEAYDEISKVLYPSYEILIDEYKSCFLYMGVFPKKYEIPRSHLTNLWIAEGLVEQHYGSHLGLPEEYAIMYIQHLALCSLVVVHQRSTSLIPYKNYKRAKSCGLHSSWWQFCQREVRKTNFFHVLDCPEDRLEEGIKGQSRLSIHNNVLFALKDVHNSIVDNCSSSAETLLCFGPYHQYQVPICIGLTLLQRLDALNIRFYEFPLEVLELVELRYLALTCNGKIPPSISKLLHLQFLIVHQCLSIRSQGARTHLPTRMWNMRKLKHLQIMGNDLPSVGTTITRDLETLLAVSAESCTKDVLERFPNLNKLGIRIELRNDAAEASRCFDHISHLGKLESLTCVVVNPKSKVEVVAPPAPFSTVPWILKKLNLSRLGSLWEEMNRPEVVAPRARLSLLPSNLKKLNLNGLGYPWEEMCNVALLPKLEVLKIRCNAFEGPTWEIGDDGFPLLYSLVIEDIDLVQLKGGQGSLKRLKYLAIKHCYKLKMLHLEDCALLSNIDVVDSNPLVEKEVKKIAVKRSVLPEHFSIHCSWKS